MFWNRMLRKILVPKRDEVTGEWKRLHNGELSDLYCSPNIIPVFKSRRIRQSGHAARVGDRIGGCRVLVGKPEGKRQLGRSRRRWENIKMYLQVGLEGIDGTDLAHERDSWRTVVNAVMNLQVPCNVVNILTS
jgi:hypothetical protein